MTNVINGANRSHRADGANRATRSVGATRLWPGRRLVVVLFSFGCWVWLVEFFCTGGICIQLLVYFFLITAFFWSYHAVDMFLLMILLFILNQAAEHSDVGWYSVTLECVFPSLWLECWCFLSTWWCCSFRNISKKVFYVSSEWV